MNAAERKETVAREQGELKQSDNNMIDRPRKVAELVFCTLGRSRLFLELPPSCCFVCTQCENMKCDLSHTVKKG